MPPHDMNKETSAGAVHIVVRREVAIHETLQGPVSFVIHGRQVWSSP